jgi:hypothetical protein
VEGGFEPTTCGIDGRCATTTLQVGAMFVCRRLVLYSLKIAWLRLHFIDKMVHLSLFNPELKVAFGSSLSYELKIWCFFFPFFF